MTDILADPYSLALGQWFCEGAIDSGSAALRYLSQKESQAGSLQLIIEGDPVSIAGILAGVDETRILAVGLYFVLPYQKSQAIWDQFKLPEKTLTMSIGAVEGAIEECPELQELGVVVRDACLEFAASSSTSAFPCRSPVGSLSFWDYLVLD